MTLDEALKQLKALLEKLDVYVANHYSEADTRVKFIDPLLTGALGWDEYLHINSWLDKPCAPSKLVSEIATTLSRPETYRRAFSGE